MMPSYRSRFLRVWKSANIQITGGGGARLQRLLESSEFSELYPHVEVRTVRRSLQALAAVQAASHRAARAQGVPMESSIDIPENRVALFTTNPGLLIAALRAADEARGAISAPS